MKKILLIILFIAVISLAAFFLNPFRAPGGSDKPEIVIIENDTADTAAIKLENKGFIRSFTAFNIAYKLKGKAKTEPGGYYLSKNMNNWQIIQALNDGPDLKSITFPEGLRKEQIGERLKNTLGWTDEELKEWNSTYTKNNSDYREGVYFPDTYLIPVKETPTQVANRMINNFNDKFALYYQKFSEQNIKWTTAIKIASIIQREAGGPNDMPIISGIIWNRLNNGQKLQMDASIQYAKGKTEGQWWSVITPSDIKNIDSPYNSYKYSGLPPHPISNPGLSAIDAVLNPQKTDCIYYLHDHSRQIHCAVTYKEHLENIEKYLN